MIGHACFEHQTIRRYNPHHVAIYEWVFFQVSRSFFSHQVPEDAVVLDINTRTLQEKQSQLNISEPILAIHATKCLNNLLLYVL